MNLVRITFTPERTKELRVVLDDEELKELQYALALGLPYELHDFVEWEWTGVTIKGDGKPIQYKTLPSDGTDLTIYPRAVCMLTTMRGVNYVKAG